MNKHTLKRQPRAKTMLPDIKLMIANEATTSDQNREKLAELLIKRIKKKYPNEIPPTIDTIVKLISRYRNHGQSPLDKPWNLGELDNLAHLNIHIDAEAIEYIEMIKNSTNQTHPFTIRQAKWISRLYRIIMNSKTENKTELLHWSSFVYATFEIISEIAEITLDTRKLDANLTTGKFMETAEKMFEHKLAEKAWIKAFGYDTEKYYSEIKEVI